MAFKLSSINNSVTKIMSSVTKYQFINSAKVELNRDKKVGNLNVLMFTNFKRNISLNKENVAPLKKHKSKIIAKYFFQNKKYIASQN